MRFGLYVQGSLFMHYCAQNKAVEDLKEVSYLLMEWYRFFKSLEGKCMINQRLKSWKVNKLTIWPQLDEHVGQHNQEKHCCPLQ